jgi:hypothetical protein
LQRKVLSESRPAAYANRYVEATMVLTRLALVFVFCLVCAGCDSESSDDPQNTTDNSIAVQYTGGGEEVSQFIKARSDPIRSDKPYVQVTIVRSIHTIEDRAWDFDIPQARIVGYIDYMDEEGIQPIDEHKSKIPYKRIEEDFNALLAHLKIQDADILWRARLELAKRSQNQP